MYRHLRRLESMALATVSLYSIVRPRTPNEHSTIANIDTVVLPLGPYRNLTTMSAAMFALHPDALVLNHADVRLKRIPWADIVAHPKPKTIRKFVDVACVMAKGGKRGDFGGNILLAHAFDAAEVRNAYEKRFGNVVLKQNARVLFWKDSMRVRNRMYLNGTTESQLIETGNACGKRIVFFQPVRHPIDCALSNIRTGHYRHLSEIDDFEAVLRRVIEEIKHFKSVKIAYPNNAMWLFEDDIDRESLVELCEFFGITPDARWLDSVTTHLQTRSNERSNEELSVYRRIVDELCSHDEELRMKLLTM